MYSSVQGQIHFRFIACRKITWGEQSRACPTCPLNKAIGMRQQLIRTVLLCVLVSPLYPLFRPCCILASVGFAIPCATHFMPLNWVCWLLLCSWTSSFQCYNQAGRHCHLDVAKQEPSCNFKHIGRRIIMRHWHVTTSTYSQFKQQTIPLLCWVSLTT